MTLGAARANFWRAPTHLLILSLPTPIGRDYTLPLSQARWSESTGIRGFLLSPGLSPEPCRQKEQRDRYKHLLFIPHSDPRLEAMTPNLTGNQGSPNYKDLGIRELQRVKLPDRTPEGRKPRRKGKPDTKGLCQAQWPAASQAGWGWPSRPPSLPESHEKPSAERQRRPPSRAASLPTLQVMGVGHRTQTHKQLGVTEGVRERGNQSSEIHWEYRSKSDQKCPIPAE